MDARQNRHLGANGRHEEKEGWNTRFSSALKYEWMFWEMAWNEEKWPVWGRGRSNLFAWNHNPGGLCQRLPWRLNLLFRSFEQQRPPANRQDGTSLQRNNLTRVAGAQTLPHSLANHISRSKQEC